MDKNAPIHWQYVADAYYYGMRDSVKFLITNKTIYYEKNIGYRGNDLLLSDFFWPEIPRCRSTGGCRGTISVRELLLVWQRWC